MTELPLQFEKHEISPHQRELIDWLDGFQNTRPFREIVAGRVMSPLECKVLKEELSGRLTPKPQKRGADARWARIRARRRPAHELYPSHTLAAPQPAGDNVEEK